MIKPDKDDVKIKECFLIRIKVEAAVLGVILLENLQRKQDFQFLPFIVRFRKFSMQSLLSAFLPWFAEESLCWLPGTLLLVLGMWGKCDVPEGPEPQGHSWGRKGLL